MSGSRHSPRLPVAVLGATGSVGQKFIELLEGHPWFEVAAVAASDRSAGKTYGEAAPWLSAAPLSPQVAAMKVVEARPPLPCRTVFSALDATVAGEIESEFAAAGHVVISNARNHRCDPDVPLLVPEVNPQHLDLVGGQKRAGSLVTNPNCSTAGLVLALKPLYDAFGLSAVQVTTMQALSGAGYPGVSGLDALDNVVPYIAGEETKLETEPLKILGMLENGQVQPAGFPISAQCHRVAVRDGHLEAVSVKLKQKAEAGEMIAAWRAFRGLPQELALPSAPAHPVVYLEDPRHPQPRLHRDLGRGMTVSVGRLRPCPVLDFKFVLLSHNTVRGAAGAAILNAELMHQRGLLEPRP